MASSYSPSRAGTLTITRGLPGSGKTTWARQQRGHVRINRDDLRRMLHGGWQGTDIAEEQVTLAQHAAVRALLTGGADVIADDTNLRTTTVRGLLAVADECGARVVFRDFTDVPLDECVRRDAARPEAEQVGAGVIRAMFTRYLAKPHAL